MRLAQIADQPHVFKAWDIFGRSAAGRLPPNANSMTCPNTQPCSYVLDDFGTGISLISSTRGVTLLPTYVEPLLPWSVVSRQLTGVQPTIDIAVGYRTDNESPVLRKVLGNINQLVVDGPAGMRRKP
jgi:DNA-binding transcriptional LysR family regulator